MSLFTQVVVWRLLQDQLPLSVDLQWALSCLCLALQQSCVWNKLSTPEYTTHTCSLIHCLRLIIVAGKEPNLVCSPATAALRLHVISVLKCQTFCLSSGGESW